MDEWYTVWDAEKTEEADKLRKAGKKLPKRLQPKSIKSHGKVHLRFTYCPPDAGNSAAVEAQHAVVKQLDAEHHTLETRMRHHPARAAQERLELGTLSKREREKAEKKSEQMTLSYLREPKLFSYEVRVHIFQAQHLPAADSNGPSLPSPTPDHTVNPSYAAHIR